MRCFFMPHKMLTGFADYVQAMRSYSGIKVWQQETTPSRAAPAGLSSPDLLQREP